MAPGYPDANFGRQSLYPSSFDGESEPANLDALNRMDALAREAFEKVFGASRKPAEPPSLLGDLANLPVPRKPESYPMRPIYPLLNRMDANQLASVPVRPGPNLTSANAGNLWSNPFDFSAPTQVGWGGVPGVLPFGFPRETTDSQSLPPSRKIANDIADFSGPTSGSTVLSDVATRYAQFAGEVLQSAPRGSGLGSSPPSEYGYDNLNPPTRMDLASLQSPPMPRPGPGIASPLPPWTVPGTPENKQWTEDFIRKMRELLQLLRKRATPAGGGGGDGDECYDRWEREINNCSRFRPFGSRFYRGCVERANDRRTLCIRNGGKQDPNEPPEYGWQDIPRGTTRE